MAVNINVPLLPESVNDATVAAWNKKVGDVAELFKPKGEEELEILDVQYKESL